MREAVRFCREGTLSASARCAADPDRRRGWRHTRRQLRSAPLQTLLFRREPGSQLRQTGEIGCLREPYLAVNPPRRIGKMECRGEWQSVHPDGLEKQAAPIES